MRGRRSQNFADQFTAEGDTRLSAANKNQKRDRARVRRQRRDAERLPSRRSSCRKVKIDEESFAKDDAFIRAMIHFEIDLALFGVEEARRNLIVEGSAGAVRAAAVSGRRQADRAGARAR